MNTAHVYSMTIDRVLAGIRTRVAEFCGMRSGDRVLDVCCGTGAQVFCYAGRGIIASGIDMDAGMIEFAERRRERLGLKAVSFQRASAEDLPFRDGSFDHASICMGLHEKPAAARDRVVSEMRRVVKKEGTLAFVDYSVPYPRGGYGSAVRLVEWLAGQEHFGCFNGFIRDGGLGPLLMRHQLRKEKMELTQNLHLEIVRTRND